MCVCKLTSPQGRYYGAHVHHVGDPQQAHFVIKASSNWQICVFGTDKSHTKQLTLALTCAHLIQVDELSAPLPACRLNPF